MMARLVELIASIRPTVRRVIKTLAIPASTNTKTPTHMSALLISFTNSLRSSISFPTRKWSPFGSVTNVARNSGWLVPVGWLFGALKFSHPLKPRKVDGQTVRFPEIGTNEGSASR